MHQFSAGTFRQARLFASPRARILLLAVVIVGLVLSVVSQTVLATNHNVPQHPVNACYDATSRVLRYIDTGTCRNTELTLSWPSMSDFADLANALAAETAARQSGDAALQGAITNEAAARQTADAALQAQLDALKNENASQATQIAALQAALAAETAARATAIAGLQAALAAEVAAREQGDATTLADANAETTEQVTTERNARTAAVNLLTASLKSIGVVVVKVWAAVKEILGNTFDKAAAHLNEVAEDVGQVSGVVVDHLTAKFADLAAGIQNLWNAIACFFGGGTDCA